MCRWFDSNYYHYRHVPAQADNLENCNWSLKMLVQIQPCRLIPLSYGSSVYSVHYYIPRRFDSAKGCKLGLWYRWLTHNPCKVESRVRFSVAPQNTLCVIRENILLTLGLQSEEVGFEIVEVGF